MSMIISLIAEKINIFFTILIIMVAFDFGIMNNWNERIDVKLHITFFVKNKFIEVSTTSKTMFRFKIMYSGTTIKKT